MNSKLNLQGLPQLGQDPIAQYNPNLSPSTPGYATQNYGSLQNLIDPRHELDQSMQNPTLGGFAKNVVSGLGSAVTGLLSLPGQVVAGVKDPQAGGQMIENAITGAASGLNNLVGQPVATKNGEITGLQAPSIYEAGSNFYKQPVSAVGSYYLGKSALGAMRGAVANATNPMGIDDSGNVTNPRAIAQLDKQTAIPGETSATPAQIAMGRQIYSQPSKMGNDAANNAYNTVIGDKQMTGQAGDVAQHIQNTLNQTEKIKQATLQSAEDSGVRIPTGQAISVGTDALNNAPEFGSDTATPAKYGAILQKMIPAGEPASDGSGIVASPTEVYEAEKNISSYGWNLLKQSKSVQGDITNPGKYAAGEAFISTGRELQDQMDTALGKSPIPTNNPAVQEALQGLQQTNPSYAQRLISSPYFQDIRSNSAPYVTMNQIIDYTGRTGNYPLAQIMNKAASGTAGAAGAIVGSPLGATGAALGATGAQIAAPLINQAISAQVPGMTNAIVNAIPKVNTALNVAGQVGEVAGAGLPAILANSKSQDIQSPQSQGEEGNVAQYVTSSTPDQDGHYSLATPNAPITPLTPGTPQYTQARNALPSGITPFMAAAPTYMQGINNTVDAVKGMPLNVFTGLKTAQNVLDYTSNPQNQYARQVSDVYGMNQIYSSAYQNINGVKPDPNQLINPGMQPDQLEQRLGSMIDFINHSYNQYYTPYAETSAVPQNSGGNGIVQYQQQAQTPASIPGMIQPGLSQTLQGLPSLPGN